MVNEKNDITIIALCVLIYPYLSLDEAIDEVYEKLKSLKMFLKGEEKKIVKYVKVNEERLNLILNKLKKVKAPISLLAKASYLKKAIEAIENVCI